MGRRLKEIVHVHGGPGGSRAFGPDDELPEWAEKKLIAANNPLIWEEGSEPTQKDIVEARDYDAAATDEVATLQREVDRLTAALKDREIEFEAKLDELRIENEALKSGKSTDDNGAKTPITDDLDSLKHPELVALAKERGVEIDSKATNAQIVEALRAAS